MTTNKITLPIEYWNEGRTKVLCPEDENGRVLECSYFFLVQFTGHSKHYPQPLMYSHRDGKLRLPTIERFMSLGRGTVYEETMEYDMQLDPSEKCCDIPVFYFAYNMANYFHFIYDTLPYLYTYFEEKKVHSDLKLLVSPAEGKDDLYPFVWETLELFGIDRNDVVFLDRNTIYNCVLVGSSLTHGGLSEKPPHKSTFDIINRLRGTYKGPEKIYISRRTWMHNNLDNIGTNYTERRKCMNEDEVAQMFIDQGFEEVFCENLTMEEKIGIFSSAKYVAGPIGGGMANILFCPNDTKVLSINSPLFFEVNDRLRHAMEHTQLSHFDHTQFTDKKEETVDDVGSLSISGGMNSPWEVNLNKLSKFLEAWMIY